MTKVQVLLSNHHYITTSCLVFSHLFILYAIFCLRWKNIHRNECRQWSKKIRLSSNWRLNIFFVSSAAACIAEFITSSVIKSWWCVMPVSCENWLTLHATLFVIVRYVWIYSIETHLHVIVLLLLKLTSPESWIFLTEPGCNGFYILELPRI